MRAAAPFAAAALLALLAGCDRHEQPVVAGIRQTHLPGDITSGGRTSGEVMAAASPGAAVEPGPAGTPGIPKGSGGNTGGADTGASVPDQTHLAATSGTVRPAGNPGGAAPVDLQAPAAAGNAPSTPPGASAAGVNPALSPSAAGLAAGARARTEGLPDAQRQKLELTAAQDALAARWRARAEAQHWTVHPPTALAAAPAAGAQGSASTLQPRGKLPPEVAAMPKASSKLGTAPDSPDVKKAKPPTDPGVGAHAPIIASPKP